MMMIDDDEWRWLFMVKLGDDVDDSDLSKPRFFTVLRDTMFSISISIGISITI